MNQKTDKGQKYIRKIIKHREDLNNYNRNVLASCSSVRSTRTCRINFCCPRQKSQERNKDKWTEDKCAGRDLYNKEGGPTEDALNSQTIWMFSEFSAAIRGKSLCLWLIGKYFRWGLHLAHNAGWERWGNQRSFLEGEWKFFGII